MDSIVQIFTAGDYKVSILLAIILVTSLVRSQGAKLWTWLGTGWAAWLVAVVLGVMSEVAPRLLAGSLDMKFAAVAPVVLSGALSGLEAAGLYSGAKAAIKDKSSESSGSSEV